MFYRTVMRNIRKDKKIKISNLANFLGKSRQTIFTWEKGTYSPGDADIRLMAQFLNVSVSDISDLKERKINNESIETEKEEVPDLDINDLTSDDTKQKLKTLHESCVEFRATNTRLRANIFKYETLLQNVPFIIYAKDKNLKYRYVNERFLNTTGGNYSKESIIGVTSSDIFGHKEYYQVLELEQKVLQTKQKISNQQIYIPGTFKQKIGLMTIIPTLNDYKGVEEIICSIEDITDIFEEQERRKDLEAVVNKVNHMLWIGEMVNGDENSFKYTFMSKNVSEIYGYEKEELLKDNNLWLKIVHNEDREMVANWKNSNEEEANLFPKKITYKINHPKKGIRWISSEIFKEGRDKFYGIVTDITEEKEKEQEKEAILRTLDAASDAIQIAKIKDDSKEYIYLNKENKNLYDLPISKIKNNPDIWKEFIHPDDIRKLLSIDEKREEGHKHINYRLLSPDGTIKYIEENIFREFIDGVLYLGSIKRDVTEEKKENEIRRLLEYVINNLPLNIWITSHPKDYNDFEFLFVSDSVEKLFHCSKEIFFKDKNYFHKVLHPDDIKRIREWWNKEADLKFSESIKNEYRIILEDGITKWVEDNRYTGKRFEDKIISYGILYDITNVKIN